MVQHGTNLYHEPAKCVIIARKLNEAFMSQNEFCEAVTPDKEDPSTAISGAKK